MLALLAGRGGRAGAGAPLAGGVRSHQAGDAGRHRQGVPLAEPPHLDRGPGAGPATKKDVLWGVELTSPTYLVRAGWKSNLIKPGDKVTVVVNPVRSGEPVGHLRVADAGRWPHVPRAAGASGHGRSRSNVRVPLQRLTLHALARCGHRCAAAVAGAIWAASAPSLEAPTIEPPAGERRRQRCVRRTAERAGAGQYRQGTAGRALQRDGQLVHRRQREPRRLAVRPAVSAAQARRAGASRRVAEGRGRGQGLPRRHRAVLAGRAAAHHDALLADGHDPAADGRSTWSAAS